MKAEFEMKSGLRKWGVQTTRMTGLKKYFCNAYCGNNVEIQVV